MLIDPQELWTWVASTPPTNGRAIDCLRTDSPGYRLLQYVGRVFELEGRHWTVRRFFLPLTQDRTVRSGVRALVGDEHGFVGFVNQRDLELMLRLRRPREWCRWLGSSYPYLDDLYGVCADANDLLDELYEHEQDLRTKFNNVLPAGTEYTRLVHREQGVDIKQLLNLLWDADPQTGTSPDCRFETIERRWVRVQEERV